MNAHGVVCGDRTVDKREFLLFIDVQRSVASGDVVVFPPFEDFFLISYEVDFWIYRIEVARHVFFLMPEACFLLNYSELCSCGRLIFELKTKPAPKWFRDGRFEIKRYRGTTLVSRRTIAYWDTQLSRCNVRLGRLSLVSRFPQISVNSSGVMVDSVPMLASTVPSSLERGARNRLCLRRYL